MLLHVVQPRVLNRQARNRSQVWQRDMMRMVLLKRCTDVYAYQTLSQFRRPA